MTVGVRVGVRVGSVRGGVKMRVRGVVKGWGEGLVREGWSERRVRVREKGWGERVGERVDDGSSGQRLRDSWAAIMQSSQGSEVLSSGRSHGHVALNISTSVSSAA